MPPAVMRLGVRQIGRRCSNPALPWPVQRTRLDQLTRDVAAAARHQVAEQDIAGMRAEVVSAGDPAVADHGGPLPRRRLLRGLGAHAPVVGRAPERPAGCRVVLPEYRLAPEHPHPAALEDARAILAALSAEAGPGSVVVSGDSAGGGLALALVLSMRDEGQDLPGRLHPAVALARPGP